MTQIRPEDNYNIRTARTFGGFDPADFVPLTRNNVLPGIGPMAAQAVPATNVFGVAPIAWNLGGIKQAFRVINMVPDTRRAVAIPFVPNRQFYAVPIPKLGMSLVSNE